MWRHSRVGKNVHSHIPSYLQFGNFIKSWSCEHRYEKKIVHVHFYVVRGSELEQNEEQTFLKMFKLEQMFLEMFELEQNEMNLFF